MPVDHPLDPEALRALALATAIGLLLGLERERHASARAGLRTFGLTGLLGAVCALLATETGSAALVAVPFALVGTMMIAAYLRRPDPQDPGTTSVVALLLCFCLGALVWFGHGPVAVMLAIGSTALLYYKAELSGVAAKLTPQDWRSILMFAVLALVILPILPDRGYGPYDALNPRQVWWMVVLISGVSLAGYAALRLVGARYGAPLLGVLGGLVSSTATTMVFARHARADAALTATASLVILLANLVMLVRIAILVAVLAPAVLSQVLIPAGAALVLGLVAVAYGWRRLAAGGALPVPETRNPTELRAALGFGALYALVLLAAAWLADRAGSGGLYLLALASGLTDVDAIALSTLRLVNIGQVEAGSAAVAISLAMLANLAFKTGLALTLGGRNLGLRVLAGMLAVAAGLAGGIIWLQQASL